MAKTHLNLEDIKNLMTDILTGIKERTLNKQTVVDKIAVRLKMSASEKTALEKKFGLKKKKK
jgi:hypothetical protein